MHSSRNSAALAPSDGQFKMRLCVAPLVLCAVAGFQMIRVFAHQQTPWKGGGFGMFSTVDSVAARFLRAYVIDGDTRVPVEIPAWLKRQATSVRTAPSRVKLQRLAQQLAAAQWLPADQHWPQIRSQCDGRAASDPVDAAIFRSVARTCDTPETQQTPLAVRAAKGDNRQRGTKFAKTRVELWRYRFDAASRRIEAAQSMFAEFPRTGPEQ